ncbi:DUF1253-domain-containing protein, partial [Rhizopogon salebrosus TDB-379]
YRFRSLSTKLVHFLLTWELRIHHAKTFIPFDCANPKDEPDKRFAYFTTQLLPRVLKSAVQSANTVIFIPSSFDFIRVHNYFRKQSSVSFVVLSEYSTNQDISRARQAFFSGKKAFLLISERFHFYRRYKIRGIRNLIFYGTPEHPQFFSEFLSFPFLDDEVEASDVASRVIYSKYDKFRLERIVGTKAYFTCRGKSKPSVKARSSPKKAPPQNAPATKAASWVYPLFHG